MAEPEYAIVGLIRKAQGIRGEVVVEPLTDKPDVVFASGSRVFAGDANGDVSVSTGVRGEEERSILTIASSRPFKKGLIVQFEEIRDRDSAELWRGRYVLAAFSELPPRKHDEIYLHDLVGMKVETQTGEPRGTVTNYYEVPQGIMLDVNTGRGSVVIPYRPELVVNADLEARTLVVNDTLGFFDSDDDEAV